MKFDNSFRNPVPIMRPHNIKEEEDWSVELMEIFWKEWENTEYAKKYGVPRDAVAK